MVTSGPPDSPGPSQAHSPRFDIRPAITSTTIAQPSVLSREHSTSSGSRHGAAPSRQPGPSLRQRAPSAGRSTDINDRDSKRPRVRESEPFGPDIQRTSSVPRTFSASHWTGSGIEKANSLLSDLTQAPAALQRLASALRTSGSGTQEELQNWVYVVSAAMQQAHRAGDPAAQALLASMTSTSSVQSTKLQGASEHRSAADVGRLAEHPAQLRMAPFRSQPPPVQEPRRVTAAQESPFLLPRYPSLTALEAPAKWSRDSFYADKRITSTPPAAARPSRPQQRTKFRVYSNTFQNQDAVPKWPSVTTTQATKTKTDNPWSLSQQSSKEQLNQSARLDLQSARSHMLEGEQMRRPVLPPLESSTAAGTDIPPAQLPKSVSVPGVAIPEGEDLAFWVRQRYNSLGQALSSSEAFINSLSAQQSTALPQVLARLQAAQQLHEAATAQGVFPAAAALGPLMQLQALVQSIGSDAASPSFVPSPSSKPALQQEAWRRGFSSKSPFDAGAVPRATGAPGGRQSTGEASSSGMLPVAASSADQAGDFWTTWTKLTQKAHREPQVDASAVGGALSMKAAEPALLDPHNPFELHRLRLSQEERQAVPAGKQLDETAASRLGQRLGSSASLEKPKPAGGSGSTPPPASEERSEGPEGGGPRAATVERQQARGDPADALAAETLLSLFGPEPPQHTGGGRALPQMQVPPAVRRARSHRLATHSHEEVLSRDVSGSPNSSEEDEDYRLGVEEPSGRRWASVRRSGDGKRKPARDDDETWVPRREARRQANARLERLQEGDPESAHST